MTGLRDLTPAERVDGLAARGIMLYAVGVSLRARYAPESASLLEAARPALAKHRAAIVAYLRGLGEGRDAAAAASLSDASTDKDRPAGGMR